MNWYNGFSPQQRVRALAWLQNEYRQGRRSRPTACDGCGQTEGIIEAHSEDYGEPFGPHIGAYAFCYRCHMMIHCRFRAQEAWHRYRAMIRNGQRAKPMFSRSFGLVTAYLSGRAIETEPTGPLVRYALDEIQQQAPEESVRPGDQG